MRKLNTLIVLFMSCATQAAVANENQTKDVEYINSALKEFVKVPHPMGSPAQKQYASHLRDEFKKSKLKSDLQTFVTDVPNRLSIKFGGSSKTEPPLLKMTGYNVTAVRPGSANCSVVLSGHYDTKFFAEFHFVGANDGGSSTALLLHLAKNIGATAAKKSKTTQLNNCDLHFVLFDGEEAQLYEWTAAESAGFTQGDNTYGSKYYANNLQQVGGQFVINKKPIAAVFVFDMVGHKKQKLSITSRSDEKYSKALMTASTKNSVEMKKVEDFIEDDHVPFARRGITFVHVIDWTNLQEWHTAQDTLNIIDAKKILNFSNTVQQFLKETPL